MILRIYARLRLQVCVCKCDVCSRCGHHTNFGPNQMPSAGCAHFFVDFHVARIFIRNTTHTHIAHRQRHGEQAVFTGQSKRVSITHVGGIVYTLGGLRRCDINRIRLCAEAPGGHRTVSNGQHSKHAHTTLIGFRFTIHRAHDSTHARIS